MVDPSEHTERQKQRQDRIDLRNKARKLAADYLERLQKEYEEDMDKPTPCKECASPAIVFDKGVPYCIVHATAKINETKSIKKR